MKGLFRVILFHIIGLSFIACAPSVTATPSPILSSTATTTATLTPIPTQTATATITSTPRPEYVPPTLIPTIDPTLLPELLRKAFSVQTIEGVNGHKIRQITGWEHGFGAGIWQYSCSGFYWLDANHLLLYPATGQENGGPEGIWRVNVAPQPVIINLKTGYVWLPSEEVSAPSWSCYPVHWSKKLELLILSGTYNGKSAIFTYTLDGKRLAYYPGNLSSISPSKTKILVGDTAIIDLRTNKRITLDWSLEDYNQFDLTDLFWTSDEKRIYRCCYFYADLTTGISHRFERSDFQDTQGNSLDPTGLWFNDGQWVLNDKYFLVEWSWLDDGDIRYLPMFDPAKKIVYDVRQLAGISDEWTAWKTDVSPDGSRLWMTGQDGSYLVNLSTFESRFYPDLSYINMDWSPSSQHVWLYHPGSGSNTRRYSILSLADGETRPFPVQPSLEWAHWWQEDGEVLIYPTGEGLVILDLSDMSFRQLPFTLGGLPHYFDSLAWGPDGKKIALIAEDGCLWQLDYPALDNLEQLTPPLPNVHSMEWSPDGNSIAFISGSDIYIVETNK